MTSQAVAGADRYLSNVTNTSPKAKMPNDFASSFGQIMNQTTKEQNTDAGVRRSEQRKTSKVQVEKSNAKEIAKDGKTTKQFEKTNETADKLKDNIEGQAEDVKEAIAKELGVSKEAVEEAMTVLGIECIDLCNPDVLAQLVLNLSGETDMLALLTDEGLYASFNKLVSLMQEVLTTAGEQLELEPEQLEQVLEEISKETEQISSKEVQTEENIVKENNSSKETADVKEVAEEAVVTVTEPGQEETSKGKEVPKEEQIAEAKVQTVQEKPMVNTESEETEGGLNGAKDRKHSEKTENSAEQTSSMLQGFTEQIKEKLDAILQENVSAPRTYQSEQILKQVMDTMKINISPQVTEMEMQLHPASLGTVNLQVAFKDGQLTAQFSAQSEAVKTALESQIVQLKENLNEQGIKVEAIEVTIASHEFERNLQQGNEQNGSYQEENKKSGSRRNINLDAIDREEEELSDAEKIAVEIMETNGNTVDFSA